MVRFKIKAPYIVRFRHQKGSY